MQCIINDICCRNWTATFSTYFKHSLVSKKEDKKYHTVLCFYRTTTTTVVDGYYFYWSSYAGIYCGNHATDLYLTFFRYKIKQLILMRVRISSSKLPSLALPSAISTFCTYECRRVCDKSIRSEHTGMQV